MHSDAHEPEAVPVPSCEETGPAAWWRAALLLGIGGGIGLALGILLTVSVATTYTLFTPTVPLNQVELVQVFNELNEMRQQINQLNEQRKLQDQATVESMRQALSAVASTARSAEGRTPGAVAPGKGRDGGTENPPTGRAQGPFAEVDEEIKRLEETQRVLNTILDMFTPKAKERARDRKAIADPPE